MDTFSGPDLDRLEAYLQDPRRASHTLPADAMQGLVTAVASAPEPVAPEVWMAVVLGEQNRFESAAEEREIKRLLQRFHDAIVRQLEQGDGFDFILYDERAEDEVFSDWCEGYLMGVELADPPWEEHAEYDEVEERLFPFVALTGRWKEGALERGEPWLEPHEEALLMKGMRDRLADAVLENRTFFREARPG
ncbi:MAG TPA: YecA family protein [Myxococcales bacterium]